VPLCLPFMPLCETILSVAQVSTPPESSNPSAFPVSSSLSHPPCDARVSATQRYRNHSLRDACGRVSLPLSGDFRRGMRAASPRRDRRPFSEKVLFALRFSFGSLSSTYQNTQLPQYSRLLLINFNKVKTCCSVFKILLPCLRRYEPFEAC